MGTDPKTGLLAGIPYGQVRFNPAGLYMVSAVLPYDVSEVVVLRGRLHGVGLHRLLKSLWWSGVIAMAVLDVGYDVERCVKVPVVFSLSTNILGQIGSRALEASLPCSPYFLSVLLRRSLLAFSLRHTSCSLANFLSRPMYICTVGCLVEGRTFVLPDCHGDSVRGERASGHYFNVLFRWSFVRCLDVPCRVHGNWLRSRMGQQGDFRQGVDLRSS